MIIGHIYLNKSMLEKIKCLVKDLILKNILFIFNKE